MQVVFSQRMIFFLESIKKRSNFQEQISQCVNDKKLSASLRACFVMSRENVKKNIDIFSPMGCDNDLAL